VLDNRDGAYSPSNKDWYNVEVKFFEGIFAGGRLSKQQKFRGIIRQIETAHNVGVNVTNITAFDYVVRLQELEIEQLYEAQKVKVNLETPSVNFISFSASINGSPSTTSVVYDGEANESDLTAGDTLYNVTDSYSTRTVVSVDTGTKTITTTAKSDSWANNDTIVDSTRVQVLDLANSNIADFPIPTIKIQNRDDLLEDPLWEGFEMMYQNGQILLGKPINWAEYLIRCSYYYYPTSSSMYVEDIIQDIITTVDGYGNIPFTTGTNLSRNFSNMANKTIDTLKPNSDTEIIDGTSYAAGRIWYLTYNNVWSLNQNSFTVQGGTISSVDNRYGRIFLDAAIGTSSIVTYGQDYTFCTLQATGIQFTKVDLTYEQINNRLEAVNKLRDLVAPNYVFQTRGSRSIWGRYLYQKNTADYQAKNLLNLSKAEDIEVYTRVRLFGRNNNPENLMMNPNTEIEQDTSDYYGSPINRELTFSAEDSGWREYTTGLGENAKIVPTYEGINSWPIVYINNIPIDNESHEMLLQQAAIKRRETYKQECHSWCQKYKQRSYRQYWIYFSHSDIDPASPITLYDANGTVLKTLIRYHTEVNYGAGYWYRNVGEGTASWVENVSTASYFVKYSQGKLQILWDEGKFRLHNSLFSTQRQDLVTASFTYSAIYQAPGGSDLLIDGRPSTQVQTTFNAKPSSGFTWAIVDFGSVKEMDAIDIVGGFYYPDLDSPARKFNTVGWFTMEYSPDDEDSSTDATFYPLCPEAINFKLEGGESKSFERDDLGQSFEARYLKIKIEDLELIPYGSEPLYVVAFSELAAYNNVVFSTEALLVTDPLDDDSNHLYDADGLLAKLGDKVYKETTINDTLTSEVYLKRKAKGLLREFTKNHTKLTARCAYGPHYEVGQTLQIVDNKNSINANYFVEAVNNNNGSINLSLAKYPQYTALGGQDPGVANQ